MATGRISHLKAITDTFFWGVSDPKKKFSPQGQAKQPYSND